MGQRLHILKKTRNAVRRFENNEAFCSSNNSEWLQMSRKTSQHVQLFMQNLKSFEMFCSNNANNV